MNITPHAELPHADRLMHAGLKAFFNIATAWRLQSDQEMLLLGITDLSMFHAWKQNPMTATGNAETLERISAILGIYKALQILFPDSKQADDWIQRPNTHTLFAGKPALHRMLSGHLADLLLVRQYLDAQCGRESDAVIDAENEIRSTDSTHR